MRSRRPRRDAPSSTPRVDRGTTRRHPPLARRLQRGPSETSGSANTTAAPDAFTAATRRSISFGPGSASGVRPASDSCVSPYLFARWPNAACVVTNVVRDTAAERAPVARVDLGERLLELASGGRTTEGLPHDRERPARTAPDRARCADRSPPDEARRATDRRAAPPHPRERAGSLHRRRRPGRRPRPSERHSGRARDREARHRQA